MPEIIEYSTCNVCLQLAERTWYFESPDGLKFEICLACLKSAQQLLAPDVCPECGGWGSVAREMNLKIGCGACAANAGKA